MVFGGVVELVHRDQSGRQIARGRSRNRSPPRRWILRKAGRCPRRRGSSESTRWLAGPRRARSTGRESSRGSRSSRFRRRARSSPTRSEYDLSSTQYAALFLPQVITAIAASLLGAGLADRFGTKRVYLAGLTAGLLSMSLLIVSQLFISNQPVAYALLLLATACLGVGFGLTVPALNVLAAAFHPGAVDKAVLVLNALLGLGTVLAPVFVAIFIGLGFWWGLPLTSAALLVGLLAVSVRLPLEVPARETAPGGAKPPLPARFWVYAGFAVLYGICETLNGNWSQLDMTSELGASTTEAALALTAFWAMVTVGRVVFAALQRRVPPRADLPRAPVPARGRLRADRASARRRAGGGRARVRARRARLLGAPAADDQLRPEGAGLGLGGGRRRRDRLLPARLRDRRVRRRPAARPRRRAAHDLRLRGPRRRRRWGSGPSSSRGVRRPPSARCRGRRVLAVR